jgi:hypothetical protein
MSARSIASSPRVILSKQDSTREGLYRQCIVFALRCEAAAQHEMNTERREGLLTLGHVFRKLARALNFEKPAMPVELG